MVMARTARHGEGRRRRIDVRRAGRRRGRNGSARRCGFPALIPASGSCSSARRRQRRLRSASGWPVSPEGASTGCGGRSSTLGFPLGRRGEGAGGNEEGRRAAEGGLHVHLRQGGGGPAARQQGGRHGAMARQCRALSPTVTTTFCKKPPGPFFLFLFLFSFENSIPFYLFGASDHFQNLWKYSWRLTIILVSLL